MPSKEGGRVVQEAGAGKENTCGRGLPLGTSYSTWSIKQVVRLGEETSPVNLYMGRDTDLDISV